MNDHKLSRGLSRHLIRQIQDAEERNRPGLIMLDTALYHYIHGVVPGFQRLALAMHQRFKEAEISISNLTPIPHPTRKRSVVDILHLVAMEGREQSYLRLQGTVCDFSRTELASIDDLSFGIVQEHALTRLFQRSAFNRSHLRDLLDTVSLFTIPTITEACRRGTPAARSVAIPFLGGLLLGGLRKEVLPDENQPYTAVISASKGLVERSFNPGLIHFTTNGQFIRLSIVIETYVGRSDLFETQFRIVERLHDLRTKRAGGLANLRQVLLYGGKDEALLRRLGRAPVRSMDADIIEIMGLVGDFFDTPDWKRQSEAYLASKTARRVQAREAAMDNCVHHSLDNQDRQIETVCESPGSRLLRTALSSPDSTSASGRLPFIR